MNTPVRFISRRGNIKTEIEAYRDYTGEALNGVDLWRLLSHFERTMKPKVTDPINYIYSLMDPRTLEIRYVGKTNNPKERMRAHISPHVYMRHNNAKCIWIEELKAAGLRPIMQVLCKCLKSESENYEYRYFKLFNYDNNLLNSAIIQKETRQMQLVL